MSELSVEEVFSNDKDPMDAIAELRRAESSASAGTREEQEEVVEDDLEQEVEEAAAEEDSGVEETDPVEDDVEQSDTTEQVTAETKPKVRKFKADGKEFEFTEQEMLDQFEGVFGKAMNFTQKTQKLAPYRKMVSALEEESITADQLNLAIDALKGDKGALAKMLKLNEVDPFDLADDEVQTGYTPKQYGKNEHQLNIEEFTNAIAGDKEYPITVDVIDNQWDQQSRIAFAENPSMIQGLHNDIKTGLFDKVAPVAMKLKVLDGNAKKSDLEYYLLAGEQLQKQGKLTAVDNLNNATQDAATKFDQASSEAKKKRAATSTRTRADRKGAIDFLDDNDEAFDEWYKKLQSSN